MTPEKLHDTLSRYARSQDIDLNSDRKFTIEIIAGLLKNEERYGYRSCPCRLASGKKEDDADIICPCQYRDPDIKEYGSCYCGLYVSREWNEGTIKHVRVPERRPSSRF